MSVSRLFLVATALGLLQGAALNSSAMAQTPKRGGTMTLSIEGEPPTFDCAATASATVMMLLGPSYSTLVKYDKKEYPKVVPDLAESWTMSPDGLSYTFKLRPNVRFHDGSPLTSADIKATFERMRTPPQGVTSLRKQDFEEISSIETPDAQTVVFRMSRASPSAMGLFASPFNCIYSARKLAQDPTSPHKEVMGSGPFQFTSFVTGQSYEVKRFDNYFRAGLPYLDGFKYVIFSANAPIPAMAGGQIDGVLRILAPQEAETIMTARGDKARLENVVTTVMIDVAINVNRKPFDDVRVRRALNLAIDRRNGIAPLSKITNMAIYGGLIHPSSPSGRKEVIDKLPGFGADINAARTEARRLLAEAGQSNLKVDLLTRNQTNPWQTIGVYVVDQWRQIGVTAELRAIAQAQALTAMTAGEFDTAIDSNAPVTLDATEVLTKFTAGAGTNFGKVNDAMLEDLFKRQRVELDPIKREQLVGQYQERLVDQGLAIPMFFAGWTSAINSSLHGWVASPGYHVGWDMAEIWRD